MYITHILIQDLVNFKGDNLIHFFDGFEDGLPNELYVFVGQNNSGKSSILQLARSCTDPDYLRQTDKDGRQTWTKINSYDKTKCGFVLCRIIETNWKTHITGFLKKEKLGLYIWATPTPEKNGGYGITCMTLDDGVTREGWTGLLPGGQNGTDLELLRDYIVKQCDTFRTWEKYQDVSPWETYRHCLPTIVSDSIKEDVVKYWKQTPTDEIKEAQNDVEKLMRRIGYRHYATETETLSGQPGQSTSLDITDKQTSKTFNIDWLPEGHLYLWSMAIQMAKVRCSASNSPTCIIVDEPTRCMHLSLVQHLSAEMKDYCRKYRLQIIITSHSPAVLRAVRLSNVYLGARMLDGSTNVRYLYEGISGEQIPDNKANVIDKRLEEILFSRMVMIVEGEGDRRLLSALVSAMSRSDYIEEWVKHRDIPVNLDDLMGMLRDITVVSAGGKDALSQLIDPLETLSIPYFMVVDGDYLIGTNSATTPTSIMKARPVRALFKACDLLKDRHAYQKLQQLLKDGKLSVTHVSIGHNSSEIGTCIDNHKKHSDGNEIQSGCRSMARKRLQAIVECAFYVLLADVAGPGVFVKYAQHFVEWFRLFTWRHLNPLDLESVVWPYIENNDGLRALFTTVNDEKKLRKELKRKLQAGFTDSQLTELVDDIVKTPSQDFKDLFDFLATGVLPYYYQHGEIRRLQISKNDSITKNVNTLEVDCELSDPSKNLVLESTATG